MTDWLRDMFGVCKPVIGMCHLKALPGDPAYDCDSGLGAVAEDARMNLRALQEGGVDAVMFSNEFSLPYLTKVDAVTVAAMARVIAELYDQIEIPFGVNVLWDPYASLDLAVATDALFVRGDIYRRLCQRFWIVGYQLRRHRASSACDRRQGCAAFLQYPSRSRYLSGRSRYRFRCALYSV